MNSKVIKLPRIKYTLSVKKGVKAIKKIDDGKGRRIDTDELFSSFRVNLSRKMLYIRIAAVATVIIITALITAVAVKASSDKGNAGGNLQVPTVLGDVENDTDAAEGEESSEDTSENNTPPGTEDVQDGEIKYIDFSNKELGGFYVKNYLESALVYDPYAKIEKYYVPNDERPLVLILHTEGGACYRGDNKGVTSVIGLGEILSSALNSMGIMAVHCAAIHESGEIADSYNNAEESIAFYLKLYPSIKYVLDITALKNADNATAGSFDGRICSQILFEICGQNDGTRDENLSLAVNLRSMLNRQGMSVAREIIVADKMLNSKYSPYYLTLYAGTENNTFEESRLATNAFALAFAEYLNKQ